MNAIRWAALKTFSGTKAGRPYIEKTGGAEVAMPVSTLPSMQPVHCTTNFSEVEDESGAGGEYFTEAIQRLNKRDEAQARVLFEKAIQAGLSSTYENYALCELGIMELDTGHLQAAVETFLRCLAMPCKSHDAAFGAASRLAIIYEQAGMSQDAKSALAVANAANRRNVFVDPAYAAGIGQAVKDNFRRGTAGSDPKGADPQGKTAPTAKAASTPTVARVSPQSGRTRPTTPPVPKKRWWEFWNR